jgi:hypothetical protein
MVAQPLSAPQAQNAVSTNIVLSMSFSLFVIQLRFLCPSLASSNRFAALLDEA